MFHGTHFCERESVSRNCTIFRSTTGKYPSSDYGDIILCGSTVIAGECYCQVMKTGTQTEMGKAQASILEDKSVRVVSVFQEKIMKVVQILVSCCLMLVLAVLLVQGIAYDGFRENARETVLNALSIMIASIPVALPLVMQVNLALGASFMGTYFVKPSEYFSIRIGFSAHNSKPVTSSSPPPPDMSQRRSIMRSSPASQPYKTLLPCRCYAVTRQEP